MSTQLMHEKRADEPSPTVFARAFRPTRASLAGWVTALFVVEIAGALIGAATGVTSWHDAFDSKGARLASPWPFLLAQIVLALVACRRSGRVTCSGVRRPGHHERDQRACHLHGRLVCEWHPRRCGRGTDPGAHARRDHRRHRRSPVGDLVAVN